LNPTDSRFPFPTILAPDGNRKREATGARARGEGALSSCPEVRSCPPQRRRWPVLASRSSQRAAWTLRLQARYPARYCDDLLPDGRVVPIELRDRSARGMRAHAHRGPWVPAPARHTGHGDFLHPALPVESLRRPMRVAARARCAGVLDSRGTDPTPRRSPSRSTWSRCDRRVASGVAGSRIDGL